MSRPRKREAVLRLLRGEYLKLVSRSLGMTAATLAGWREAFLGGGRAALNEDRQRGFEDKHSLPAGQARDAFELKERARDWAGDEAQDRDRGDADRRLISCAHPARCTQFQKWANLVSSMSGAA